MYVKWQYLILSALLVLAVIALCYYNLPPWGRRPRTCPECLDCQVLVDRAVSERNSYWVAAKKQAVDGAIVAERLACMEQVRQGYQAGRDDKVCPQCPPCPSCPEIQCPPCPETQCPPCPDKVCPPDRFDDGYKYGWSVGCDECGGIQRMK